MKFTPDRIHQIKQAKRELVEEPRIHEMEAGTCTTLLLCQLMDLTEAVNRVADVLEQRKGGES